MMEGFLRRSTLLLTWLYFSGKFFNLDTVIAARFLPAVLEDAYLSTAAALSSELKTARLLEQGYAPKRFIQFPCSNAKSIHPAVISDEQCQAICMYSYDTLERNNDTKARHEAFLAINLKECRFSRQRNSTSRFNMERVTFASLTGAKNRVFWDYIQKINLLMNWGIPGIKSRTKECLTVVGIPGVISDAACSKVCDYLNNNTSQQFLKFLFPRCSNFPVAKPDKFNVSLTGENNLNSYIALQIPEDNLRFLGDAKSVL